MQKSEASEPFPPLVSKEAASDAELLQKFIEAEDQEAFRQFVIRYVNLVYSTAVRQLAGDVHLARDVTQTVFNDAARRARTLAHGRVLSSWLYTCTCFTAAKTVRSEQRRRKREATAQIMHDLVDRTKAETEWNQLRPVLDHAMQRLKAEDRDALLLRFFEAKSFSEIGERLRLTENAARMRVERALEKLRAKLVPLGITSTATALSGTLAFHAVTAAPVGWASLITTTATSGVAATASLSLLQWLALNKVVAVSSAALLTITLGGVHWEQRAQARLQAERSALDQQLRQEEGLRKEVDALAERAAEIAALRQDDAELERLRTEAAVLHAFLQNAVTTPTVNAPKAPPVPGKVFGFSDLDRKPVLKQQTPPKYPFELRQAEVSGEAKVSFVVDPEGKVQNVKVLDATHKSFESAASQAVQTWTFEPGMKDGKAVSTQMSIPIVFSLNPTGNDWF